MAVFTSQINAAQRLLAANGAEFTLRKLTPGSPADASKPWRVGADSAAEHTITAVVLPAGAAQIGAFDNRVEDEALTQGQRRYLLVAAKDLAVDIVPHDVINGIEGEDGWEVAGTILLAPNGEKILWEVVVQR